jgi:hypothetical protein
MEKTGVFLDGVVQFREIFDELFEKFGCGFHK